MPEVRSQALIGGFPERRRGKKGEKDDDPAPFGSLRYYDELIAKTKKLRDEATSDADRKKFDDKLKEYEAKVKDLENRIILSGRNVALKTLESTIKGIKDVTGQFDTRMDIEKVFGGHRASWASKRHWCKGFPSWNASQRIPTG